MSTTDRPSVDERMDAWLNEQADQVEVPDEDRQRFIDALRETDVGKGMRARFLLDHMGDLGAAYWKSLPDTFTDWAARHFPRKDRP